MLRRLLQRIVVLLFLVIPAESHAIVILDQSDLQSLEQRVDRVEDDVRDRASEGGLLMLFGAFCALWAQKTRRNAWLWFFLGAFFNVVTVLVLLYKNSNERAA